MNPSTYGSTPSRYEREIGARHVWLAALGLVSMMRRETLNTTARLRLAAERRIGRRN